MPEPKQEVGFTPGVNYVAAGDKGYEVVIGGKRISPPGGFPGLEMAQAVYNTQMAQRPPAQQLSPFEQALTQLKPLAKGIDVGITGNLPFMGENVTTPQGQQVPFKPSLELSLPGSPLAQAAPDQGYVRAPVGQRPDYGNFVTRHEIGHMPGIAPKPDISLLRNLSQAQMEEVFSAYGRPLNPNIPADLAEITANLSALGLLPEQRPLPGPGNRIGWR